MNSASSPESRCHPITSWLKSSSKEELHDRKCSGTKKRGNERNPTVFPLLLWAKLSVFSCFQLKENIRGTLHIRLVSLGNLKADGEGEWVGPNCSIQWSLAWRVEKKEAVVPRAHLLSQTLKRALNLTLATAKTVPTMGA